MHILGLVLFTLLVWTSAAEAGCSGSGTTWSCKAGSTSDDVQSAINSATDEATITFDEGSYTLSSWVKFSNTKGTTLICARFGACIIKYTTNQVFGGDFFGGTNTRLYRIAGFVFDAGGSGNAYGTIWFDNANGTNPVVMTKIRIDHNTFQDMSGASTGVFFGHDIGIGNYYGVIDHNTFRNSTQMTPLWSLGTINNSPPESQLGTINNLFFEDNTITFTSMPFASSGGCTDGWGGSAYVLRYNRSLNCLWALHGVAHGGGPANVEFYNNTIRLDSGSIGSGVEDCYRCFHHQGSGTFIAFNNVFTAYSGKSGEVISLLHYRDYQTNISGAMSQCDGMQSIDGNRTPVTTYRGYPCWRQPGRDFAGNLSPIYVWNNYWSDTLAKVPMTVPAGAPAPLNYYTNHMKADREWYNSVSASAQSSSSSPFNGTTGMGFGTLANRPTTCTTNLAESGGGVGYFATDVGAQGTLYRCSATNTWAVHYIPYTYPHPLQAGGGGNIITPAPPGRLKIR